MPDHSIPIRDALRAVAEDLRANEMLPVAVQFGADDVVRSPELMGALHAMTKTVLALRDAKQAANDALDRAEAALTEALVESGAYQLRTEHHVVTAVDSRPRPIVTNPAAIPPSLMRQRDPEPDMAAIKNLISAGQSVPGVTLNNPQPHLRIAAKKA